MSFSTGNRSSRCRPTSKDEWERHRQDQLDLMRRYAYGAGCRQQAIMDYFGDADTLPEGCGRCDNCQTPDALPVDDKTQETVRILLSGAARLDGRFGGNQLADLVTGSDTAQIRRYNHDQLPTYGRLSSMTKRQVQAMIQALDPAGLSAARGITLSGTGHHRRRPRGHAQPDRSSAGLLAARPSRKPVRDRPATRMPRLPKFPRPKHGALRQALRGVALAKTRRKWAFRLTRFSGIARSMNCAYDGRALRKTWPTSGASVPRSGASLEPRFSR